MFKLRKYQTKYVKKLKEEILDLLDSSEKEICVFQSPTGSGKTIIMAECLKDLCEESEKVLSFIWVSVRKLHNQSKDKLERYYESSRVLKCSNFNDLTDKKIDKNEILFINWESINKKNKSTIIKENEQEFYLEKVIENTREDGNEVILIIDESHHTASSDKSKELISSLSPKVTVEVSATPHLNERLIKVRLDEVKSAEMIKKEISINPEFMKIKIDDKESDEVVITQGLRKREQLRTMYTREKSNINPLMLVQLPDKKQGIEEKKDKIVSILKNNNVTEENGKLAIWLSEDKSNTLSNIEKPDNEVEVLIFKQAIALGWDCPRASILVIFRESKSFSFTIQTIGRIMRMPELKHYTEEELNKGFVFTNLENINITEDYAKDYLTVYESRRRNDSYKQIKLKSFYLKRQRARTRISGEFSKIFMDVAKKINLSNKITKKPSSVVRAIISDGKIENIDIVGEVHHKDTREIKISERELQELFDNFIIQNCTPYAPKDSSDRMKTALYNYLNKELGLEKYSAEAQKIVVGKENMQFFLDAISLAKEIYKTDVVEPLREKKEFIEDYDWEIPSVIGYTSRYVAWEPEKSIMTPLYLRNPSTPEKNFITKLNSSNKLKWWFRNGETENKYFAVVRADKEGCFYPDFIVYFNDGTIGLFDTKLGGTAKTAEAGPRAEGLQSYIKEENKKRKKNKFVGGIVIEKNKTWFCNDKEKYTYDNKDLIGSGWEILEL